MEGMVKELKDLEEFLYDEFPWLDHVTAIQTGLVKELVLVFLDGSQASVPLLGGIPAPEDPKSPFGQAILRAWERTRGAKVER
jgi:hypothetical protein